MFKPVDAIYCWSGAVSSVYVIILHKLYYLFKKTDKSQNSGLCFDNWLSWVSISVWVEAWSQDFLQQSKLICLPDTSLHL